jgi:hypothetical protein
MNNSIYTSSFKDHIKNYVELKQAIGYKFNTEAHHLKRFDNFIGERYPEASFLTKEIVLEWCRKKTYEAQQNQCTRTSLIRQFGIYLDSIGVKAYILPKGYYPVSEQYIPYIYVAEWDRVNTLAFRRTLEYFVTQSYIASHGISARLS